MIDELIADDFVSHDPPPGLPGTKDGFRQLAEMVTAAISDRKIAPTSSSTPPTAGWSRTGR